MNKLYQRTLMTMLTFGMASSLLASGPHKPLVHKPWKQKKTAVTLTVPARVAEDVATVTVIDEDFSRLTAGTLENPDPTDIGSNYQTGYLIKEGFLSVKGWTGTGVHQAGGACALMSYQGSYGESNGWMSTPEMELYGECRVTLRARRTPSCPEAGDLWLALCDNEEGPVDSKTFVLTSEWQELEFVSREAPFKDICIPERGILTRPREGDADAQ